MARDGSQQNDRELAGKTAMSGSSGTLYIVGTPIGHPDDISLRALATLRAVSIIASKDPRETQRLLIHHGITATVTSYGPLHRQEKCGFCCTGSPRGRMSPSCQIKAAP